MSQSFNQGADGAQNQDQQGQGSSFSAAGSDDNQNQGDQGGNPQLSAEDLTALQKRDTHAQEHIQRLEDEATTRQTELDALQVKLDQAADVDELLRNREGNTALDADEVAAKAAKSVRESMQADTAKQVETSNFDSVSTAITERYGKNADEAVKKACEENGMSWEEMVTLSKKNPKLAMKLCEVEIKVERKPSQGSINPSAVLGQLDNQQQPQRKNIMDLRTDRERVNDFNSRLDEKLKQLNNT